MLARALDEAFDRLGDFCAVQCGEHGRLTPDGVNRLQQAVGVTDPERALLVERLPELSSDAAPGSVLLGILLGLLAAEAQPGPRASRHEP